MDGVVRLADLRLTDATRVGGKAAGLGELIADGVRVPDGLVLMPEIASTTDGVRAGAITDVITALGDGPFAVRSSGIAEDGADRSFAGQYESVLGVRGTDLGNAIDRSLASGRDGRVAAYAREDAHRMAVIVQRMVDPVAAGVAFTADPINGDRRSVVITAVRGLGERLVGGTAIGDEWLAREGEPILRRRLEGAIDASQVQQIAATAREIAERRGSPQDVEWAIDREGVLWVVQSRPMTALPPDVSWEPPVRGAYSRVFRFGEWIPEPVTPLFESWLLTRMEERLHELHHAWIGQPVPNPYHVVVNGWYFYSLSFLPTLGGSFGRSLPNILWHAIRSPRRVAGMLPPTVRHAWPLYEREWREDLQPRYREAVAKAEADVEVLRLTQLPALIDNLAALAGDYFASIAVVAGSAYKVEILVAEFYNRHLAKRLGGSHVPLLAGLTEPRYGAHAVTSLDWWRPAAEGGQPPDPAVRDRLVAARLTAEQAAADALADSPRRLRAFQGLLADAQHLVPVREEQLAELTLPWPVMRRAALRIGEALASDGVIGHADDVFWLTQTELREALPVEGASPTGRPLRAAVAERRSAWERDARLVPPLYVGQVPWMLRFFFERTARSFGAKQADHALVTGAPASPGRATGPVRVIRVPSEFSALRDGEILVAPLTAPAWTPLFAKAAAVVTDVGSVFAHASIIAREYGIPAVVGCGDATARLCDGMRVTVDGGTGIVEPA
jgi:pyruvate,water dikinase